MLKRISAIILVFFLVFLGVGSVYAQGNDRLNNSERQQRIVTIPQDEVVNQNFYVNAGDIVEISGTVNGDVVVAGGQVFVDGVVNGDLLAAGGTITVSGDVGEDIRVAGGQITISGEVGRNITIVGGNLEITENAVLGGGLLVAGGNVTVNAPAAGDMIVAAGNLTLSNSVAGNVRAYVGAIRLTSNAQINGNLTYTSDQELSMAKGASISGTLTKLAPPPGVEVEGMPSLAQFGQSLFRLKLQAALVSYISALVIGFLLIRFFPNYTKSVSDVLESKVLRSLGIGLAVLFLTPLVLVLLLVTIIGIPIAVISLFAYITYIYIAKIFIGYFVARKLFSGGKRSEYLTYAVGLLVYYLVTLIPVLGGFVRFFALVFGLGAMLITCSDYYQKAVKAKLA